MKYMSLAMWFFFWDFWICVVNTDYLLSILYLLKCLFRERKKWLHFMNVDINHATVAMILWQEELSCFCRHLPVFNLVAFFIYIFPLNQFSFLASSEIVFNYVKAWKLLFRPTKKWKSLYWKQYFTVVCYLIHYYIKLLYVGCYIRHVYLKHLMYRRNLTVTLDCDVLLLQTCRFFTKRF